MNDLIASVIVESPIGPLLLAQDGMGLCALRAKREDDVAQGTASSLLDEAARQLGAYFEGSLRAFDLPLSMHGTEFEKRVFMALTRIPFGEIRTYGDIAAALCNPRAIRAVGRACARNPLWIVVPCHRVVGASGGLVGYEGGIEMKRALLTLEGQCVENGRVLRQGGGMG